MNARRLGCYALLAICFGFFGQANAASVRTFVGNDNGFLIYKDYAYLPFWTQKAIIPAGTSVDDVSDKIDCYKANSYSACEYVPKGVLKFIPIMKKTDFANVKSKGTLREALVADARLVPKWQAGGNMYYRLADIRNRFKGMTFGQAYMATVNSLSYDYDGRGVSMETHSGLSAYDNKIAVCDGYVKLLVIASAMNGVDGLVIEKGQARDGSLDTVVAHAWITKDGKAFDPTFDDASTVRMDGTLVDEKKVPADIAYYALPIEVIMADRLIGGGEKDLTSVAIKKRYEALSQKPEYTSIPLLASYAKTKALGLDPESGTLTIDKLAKFSACGAIVDADKYYKYACNGIVKSAAYVNYTPNTPGNLDYILQKVSVEQMKNLYVVRFTTGEIGIIEY